MIFLSDYTEQALKTETEDYEEGRKALDMRILHAVMGLSTEAGELLGIVKRYTFYNSAMLAEEMKEEIGDLMWYLALLLDATGLDLQEIMDANIEKLRIRHGDKFRQDNDTNRDEEAEKKVFKMSFDPYGDEYRERLAKATRVNEQVGERIYLTECPLIATTIVGLVAKHNRSTVQETISGPQLRLLTEEVFVPGTESIQVYPSPATLFDTDPLFHKFVSTVPNRLRFKKKRITAGNMITEIRKYHYRGGWLDFKAANEKTDSVVLDDEGEMPYA